MVHTLKTETKPFNATARGAKFFEVRKHDRDFQIGDTLRLNQLDKNGILTGKSIWVRVSWITNDSRWCKTGYIIMGTKGIRKNWE